MDENCAACVNSTCLTCFDGFYVDSDYGDCVACEGNC